MSLLFSRLHCCSPFYSRQMSSSSAAPTAFPKSTSTHSSFLAGPMSSYSTHAPSPHPPMRAPGSSSSPCDIPNMSTEEIIDIIEADVTPAMPHTNVWPWLGHELNAFEHILGVQAEPMTFLVFLMLRHDLEPMFCSCPEIIRPDVCKVLFVHDRLVVRLLLPFYSNKLFLLTIMTLGTR